MKKIIPLIVLFLTVRPVMAATPAPHKLLSADTVAMVTAPDMNVLRTALKASPLAQFWNDPAMKDFSGTVEKALEEKIMAPLRERMGEENPGEFLLLAQGQVTLGITMPPEGKNEPGILMLVDSGKKADALAKKMEEGQKKLREAGRTIVERDIRGVKFFLVKQPVPEDDFRRRPRPEFHVGLSDTLLVVGNNPDELEKLLVRQAGGSAPGLDKHPAFARRLKAQFREASIYGWLDFAAVLEKIEESLPEEEQGDPAEGPALPGPRQVIGALGFRDLKTISFSISKDLYGGEFFLEVPERGRRGLFAMMTPDSEDVTPPAFVGANVASFSRSRFNPGKIWSTFEGILKELSPEAGQMVEFLERAMQVKDPQFKFKEGFVETFGNDIISFEMPSKGEKMEDLISRPSIYMVASKKPAVTLSAIRNLVSFASPDAPKEREFLGRTIYTYELLAALAGPGAPDGKVPVIHMTTSAGYLVISADTELLEDFLRGPQEDDLRPLSAKPGLKNAASKVGGLKGGLFAYDDGKDIFRSAFRILRKNPDIIKQVEEALPLRPGGDGVDLGWLDVKLLPEFKKVEKYFPYGVFGMASGKEGLSIKAYSPPLKN